MSAPCHNDDLGPKPEDICEEAELKSRLRELAARLPLRPRRTFRLPELQGLSVHETASILKLSLGMDRLRLSSSCARCNFDDIDEKAYFCLDKCRFDFWW